MCGLGRRKEEAEARTFRSVRPPRNSIPALEGSVRKWTELLTACLIEDNLDLDTEAGVLGMVLGDLRPGTRPSSDNLQAQGGVT